MRKALIYIRVSTEDQVRGYSLERQRERCIAKAQELGAQAWEVFEDARVSGSLLQRPALLQALDRLKKDQESEWYVPSDKINMRNAC